ncbi:hypothetical protein [Microbacterium dextranolyticum]|uniref:Uncharacterized protein n=1 Tax=Microbacterium dextranolyticum TaxID=36806 RepID=A0A9W6HJJ8_9MICO|nr:hypothetical protein [Microbacterium dextranolyticum]MBM7462195.1 hypothetical protein [Microbacterium dextranolyticum]GLJ94445.1 hypothetical protein GCM10017591_05060 [Microbacterium dextranolyticum]
MIPQVLMGVGAVALAAFGIGAAVKSAKETAQRRATPVEWDPRFSREAFQDFINKTTQRLPRVYASHADGLIVTIHVKSNTGLTSWKAEVDFCDYGRLTGKYWITSENTQSPIPQALADAVVAEVHTRQGIQNPVA